MTLYVINRAEEWFNEKLRKAIDVTVDRKGLILKINFFHKINLLGSGGETCIFSRKHQWFVSGDIWIIIRESLAWEPETHYINHQNSRRNKYLGSTCYGYQTTVKRGILEYIRCKAKSLSESTFVSSMEYVDWTIIKWIHNWLKTFSKDLIKELMSIWGT